MCNRLDAIFFYATLGKTYEKYARWKIRPFFSGLADSTITSKKELFTVTGLGKVDSSFLFAVYCLSEHCH